MPQAIVDPEELRRFARSLGKFNTEVENNLTSLRGQMKRLESSWRDQEQQKFAEEFQIAMQAMARFSEAASQHVPLLLRKAQHIEAYLSQR